MLALAGGIFAALFGTDMAVKQYVEDTFEKGKDKDTVLKHVVLRKVHNKGFALNTLDQYPKVIRNTSLISAGMLTVYDILLFRKRGKWLEKLGMILVSAGAASNIFDRLVRGKVIDYIGFKSRNKFLADITANLADFYVGAGAVIVSVVRVMGRKK